MGQLGLLVGAGTFCLHPASHPTLHQQRPQTTFANNDQSKLKTNNQSNQNIKKVLSVRVDLKYWPTTELVLDLATATWARRVLSSAP